MTTFTKTHRDFSIRVLAAIAVAGSSGLVVAAGTLPEGLERGELIVSGYAVMLGVLAAVAAVRAAYALGFSQAFKARASQANSALTA